MTQKYVQVLESDLQQLIILSKVIAEGKFEIKGDAILTVASSLRYLGQLAERFKNAGPVETPLPPFSPLELPRIEVDTSKLKGRRRGK